MHNAPRQDRKGAIDLVEESVHLLRLCPMHIIVLYYVGNVPFVLGFLYFWADMSMSAFADRHCGEAALGLSVLYLWMKCWQSVFAHQLHARLCGKSPLDWNIRRLILLVMTQAIIQPTALFVLPIAAIITLPAGWVYCFYQNASLFGDGEIDDIREVVKRSWRQALLWPGQNHLVLALLYGFGFFIFVNLFVAGLLMPFLLKTLLGIENTFEMGELSLLNTTFFATIASATYLCVNPLIKTVYVLRCFYGQSLRTGEDLKTELRPLLAGTKTVGLATILLCTLWVARVTATAPTENDIRLKTAISPPDLDHSINEVINHPEFTWRMPREKTSTPDAQKSLVARFADAVINFLDRQWQVFKKWISKAVDWIMEFLKRHIKFDRKENTSSSFDWMITLHVLVFTLLALVTCALAFLIWQVWLGRKRMPVTVVSEAVVPVPDLADENLIANQLPTEGWLEQARTLMDQGQLRLALRALYLASLAHLAQREFIVIAKFKSNCDYERELQRRARSRRELLRAFSQNVSLFESAWYGMHEVTEELIGRFTANFDEIRGHVEN